MHKIEQTEYPKCDKCGRPVKRLGKIIWSEGRQMYVHYYYNMLTEKCNKPRGLKN